MAPKTVTKKPPAEKAAEGKEPEKKAPAKREAEADKEKDKEKEEPPAKVARKDPAAKPAAKPAATKSDAPKAAGKAEPKKEAAKAAAKSGAKKEQTPKKEEAKKEETKKEEAKKEEAKKEEAKKEEAKKEEAKKEEAKKQEAKKEEAKREEAKKEEAKKEEAKQEETGETKAKAEEEVDATPKEREVDAAPDKRPVIKETITFHDADCTLNVVPTAGGKVLMALSDGGVQYLIAGARANVGLKAGRYLYEVKIIETLTYAEPPHRGRVPLPRQLVRLGFSTANAPLVLADSEECAYFDSEGFFVSGAHKQAASQRFNRDQVIGILLNLDPKSPNANTLSIFREGERISEPQPLPEHLHGKALFPHISFRNVTVQTLFGAEPAKPLAFKCRTVQSAATADSAMKPAPECKDSKYDVVLPVGFPDEGTFDWVDTFLKKNPHYVELSDRTILDWASSSGLGQPHANRGPRHSNDKPEFNFGLPGMDDYSIRRLIYSIAPVVPRNYVIMEVKSNLLAAERKEALKKFSAPHFRKIGHVVMGEPSEEHKKMQQEFMLKEKQEKADAEWKARKLEEERRKHFEARQKELQEMRQRAEEARKKALEAITREAAEEAKEAMEAKEGEGEEPVAMETEQLKEEVPAKVEEEAPAEKKDEEMPPVEEQKEQRELGEAPPKAELSEEEQKLWFRQQVGTADLAPAVLAATFAHFTIPDKEEGFDEVRFEWQKEDKAKEYLKSKIQEKKVTTRIEELQPSQFFRDTYAAWQKQYQEWQAKHEAWKAANRGKELQKPPTPVEKKEGEEGDAEEQQADEKPTVDIFSVQDISDIGNGEPLFAHFAFEDWALLQLRYELYLLQLAFRKDVDDPERLGVHETHLVFYFQKYFRKTLNPKFFGLNTNFEVVDLVKDTVTIDPSTKVLMSTLAEEPENVDVFVKLAEENRRERQRRIDAGDETHKLKFLPAGAVHNLPPAPRPGVGLGGNPMAVGMGTGAPRSSWSPRPHQPWQARPGGYGKGGYGPAPGKGAGKWSAGPYTPRQPGPFGGQKWR